MSDTATSPSETSAADSTAKRVAAVPYPYVVVDPDGEITAVNDRVCNRVGHDRETLVGASLSTILSIPTGSVSDLVATCADTGAVEGRDALLRKADGETVPVSVRGNATDDDSGALRATHWQFHDRESTQVGTDDTTHASMERVIEAVPHPLYVLDVDDYTIQHANALADGHPGNTCYSVTHERDQPCDMGANSTPCPLQEVVETGEPTTVEHTHYDGDGNEQVHEVHAAPIFDDDGNVVQMVESLIDTTERAAYEAELKQQRDDLETLNQVLRHDIRNDLQLVLSYNEVLAESVDPAHQEHVSTIIESAEHAVELTRTAQEMADVLLDTEASVDSIALRPILDGEIDSIRTAHDDATITLDGDIPNLTVAGDEMLESVFRNLLKNAIQHNDKPVPEITVSVTADDETATVRIADNGPGVPDNLKQEIFGKGEKGMNSAGTGLGLYLVDTLVSTYGGSVAVEDNEPEGAVFVVTLPRAD
jgi:PAS domain S-box-containing protein